MKYQQVIEVVADYYDLLPQQLTGASRDRDTSLARDCLMYMLRRHGGYQNLRIARILKRTQSAISIGIKRWQERIRRSEIYRQQSEHVDNRLKLALHQQVISRAS